MVDESNNVISSSSSSSSAIIIIPKTEVSSDKEEEQDDEVKPQAQVGVLTLELPSDHTGRQRSKPPLNGESLASTSGSQLKSYFVGMGFSPTLVDKVLQENGEDNVDLLLETLFTYSAIQKMSPEPSNSLDGSFSLCDNGSDSSDFSTGDAEMEDQDGVSEVIVDKRAALLVMNFSEQEVDFAIDELGERAPVNELVDFIIAAQIAESSRKDQVKSKYRLARIDMDNSNSKRLHFFLDSSTLERRTATDTDNAYTRNRNLAMAIKSCSVKLKALAACPQETTTETLFGTMDRTLRLLEMGFSENEISSAMDKYGLEISTGELADSIFAKRIGDTCSEKDKEISDNWTYPTENHPKRSYETLDNEASCSNPNLDSKEMDFNDILKGKRPKHEYEDHGAFLGPSRSEPKAVQPKATSYSMPSSSLPSWKQEVAEESVDDLKMPELPNVGPSRRIHGSVAKPPYFFYGNVLDVSYETWDKVSQFLYAIAPEFVNAQFFSALIRKEGYVHNLPTDNRSPILPRPSMTIEGALPHTKPWWPSWDTRKQLSSICSDTRGSFQICDRLGKILANSKGMISKEQQAEILHSCKTLNLVWMDEYKLKPIEPEQIETILGYPRNHTQILIFDPMERLRSLKHSFQIDTLGYHLSGLKPIFPNGLTMLSLYSGIGGAEVALHRLGIRLKCVVSVEASEMNRKILKRWWGNTGQTGELVQLEDINRLTGNKLKTLAKDFGDFDFIICQNPCDISSTTSKSPLGNETGLDFTMFYEFVRVLQRLRSTIR